jgi:hypothetical protein
MPARRVELGALLLLLAALAACEPRKPSTPPTPKTAAGTSLADPTQPSTATRSAV